MSNRLAFQTQLASIMEALANAAVAEICKLVDDDYAVVRLQMTQCQTENKVLKRKLHLLELKMARGNAERRLRESVMNRPRVQITTGDRLRQSPSSDGVFHPRLDAGLWSERAAAGNAPTKLTDDDQSRCPDVELVEPEAVTVKEEKVDPNGSQEEKTEPDVQLIGDDGVVDSLPFGVSGSILGHQDTQSSSCQPQSVSRPQSRRMKHSSSSSSSNRGVEVSDSSPRLKCEVSGSQQDTTSPQQFAEDRSARSSFDTLFVHDGADKMLAQQPDERARAVPEGRGSSCSYSMVAADFLSSSVNGWTSCTRGPPFPLPLPQPRAASHKLHPPPSTKERLFVCSYCGKAFNRPKKVEIHQRIHTGEKPFSCSTCGKMFSEAGNLRKHHRVHTGEKPYGCGACGKGFAWIRNLKAHQRKSHPDIYTEGGQVCT